ncbi:hypothetical protein NUH87_31130 [Pseudomonas batumici]|uniref:hypothetical protein n=1 Tax=Pseudomonas batumici TaxID=226910 RepID=UPI0030CC1B5D
MSTVQTDRLTFNALTLAQGAINAVQWALPYGSNNQLESLKATRTGEDPQGQTGARVNAIREGLYILLRQPHAPLPPYFAEGGALYWCAMFSGVALYYGAGNCGEHASLAFNYLTLFGFPGIEIQRVNSDFNEHAFCVITWDGCKDPVICDAWASQPQACLYSHFFANPKLFPSTKVPCPNTKSMLTIASPKRTWGMTS